jgi:4-amino-4-deoxy-L-arabinose transferase-like glycosyltransferase
LSALGRGRAYAVIVGVCVLPRLAVLLHERGQILAEFVEKSDVMARVFVETGTFGYVPGEPSASTQPFYGWFLVAVYWIGGRNWIAIGTAQILVAAIAAVLVYETGRRYISPRAGLLAALIWTVQPYLLWHDLHVNREIVDQPLGVAMFFLALRAGETRSLPVAGALGLVTGLAVLSNSRLALFPLVLGLYLVWRHAGWAAAALVPLMAAVAIAPWVVRNKVEVGCFTLTTDARALWKANNLNTLATLRAGGWIDDVPDLPNRPPTPSEVGDIYEQTGRRIPIDECAQQEYYQELVLEFWREHPGEKAKLAAQATAMLWDPRVDLSGRTEGGGATAVARRWFEPAYMIPLVVLALVGLFAVVPSVRVLAIVFLVYETAMAWIFVGTTRYRVPWDFVLALLAAAAIERWLSGWRPRWPRPFSQKR